MIIGGDGPPPSLDELLEIDDSLAEAGVAALRRPIEAAKVWGDRCGDLMIALKQEPWFRAAYQKIHPSVPFDSEAFLTLCVSARAVSYFLKPPMGYGRVAIKPLDYVAISEPEIRRLFKRHPTSFWELQWQACDGVDLFMSHVNFHPADQSASNMMATAINQMTASARQLVACEVDLSLPQGMAMACELAGKSVLLSTGTGQAALRTIGHDLPNLAREIASKISSPLDSLVLQVAEALPSYVAVRYDAPEIDIADAQDIFRRTLFVVADFLRRTNHYQLYWKMVQDGSVPPRVW